MSILGAAPAEVWFLLILVPPCLGAVAMMLNLGVLRPSTIQGPLRLDGDESALLLAMLVLTSMLISGIAGVLLHPFFGTDEKSTLAVGAILSAVIFISLLILNTLTRRNAIQSLGLQAKQILRGAGYGLLGIVLLLPLVYLSSVLVGAALKVFRLEEPKPHALLQYLHEQRTPGGMAMVIFSAGVLAPLSEELLFRGHLQTILPRALRWIRGYFFNTDAAPFAQVAPTPSDPVALKPIGYFADRPAPPPPALRWTSVAITAMIFALVHGEPAFVLPLFVLALGLGYVYERTGNLWAPIFMHALFNTTQIIYFLSFT